MSRLKMNLLLLLSALLSALTGGGASARVAGAPAAAFAERVIAPSAAPAEVAVTRRPAAGLPSRRAVTRSPLIRAFALPRPVPLFLSRRRE